MANNNKETWHVSAEKCLPRRRNLITGGALFCAITAAGVDGALRIRRIQKATEELEPIRPNLTETEIEANRKLAAQYDSCQEITSGRCNEIISSKQLAEVERAKAVVRQNEEYKKKVEQRIRPDDLGLKLDVACGVLSIPSIICVDLAAELVNRHKHG
jgi:hypothetical protein